MTATRSQINSLDGKYLHRSPQTTLHIAAKSLFVLAERLVSGVVDCKSRGGGGGFHRAGEICWSMWDSGEGKRGRVLG